MRHALDTLALPPAYDDAMWRYFTSAADSLRNVRRLSATGTISDDADQLVRRGGATPSSTRSTRAASATATATASAT